MHPASSAPSVAARLIWWWCSRRSHSHRQGGGFLVAVRRPSLARSSSTIVRELKGVHTMVKIISMRRDPGDQPPQPQPSSHAKSQGGRPGLPIGPVVEEYLRSEEHTSELQSRGHL